MNKSIGVLFPGQGSQAIGMLSGFSKQASIVQEVFQVASEVLGYDLWKLTQQGPPEQLNETTYTQPALLAAGVAAWHVLQAEQPFQPSFLAGHSLGEYTALVCAGALEFPTAIRLVSERGRLMQEAVLPGQGAMAAVLGLAEDKLRDACRQAAHLGTVEIANYNTPLQIVIAGHSAAVQHAGELAKQAGAKRVVSLPVSVPSHCSLMKPAAHIFRESLHTIIFKIPKFPVYQNIDAKLYTQADEIKNALAEQLYLPVRWSSIIENMLSTGVNAFIESGPGGILSRLTTQINKETNAFSANDEKSIEKWLTYVRS